MQRTISKRHILVLIADMNAKCEALTRRSIELLGERVHIRLPLQLRAAVDCFGFMFFFHGKLLAFVVLHLINPFAFNALHICTWKWQIAITIQYMRQSARIMWTTFCADSNVCRSYRQYTMCACVCVFAYFITLVMRLRTAKVSHKMEWQTVK